MSVNQKNTLHFDKLNFKIFNYNSYNLQILLIELQKIIVHI